MFYIDNKSNGLVKKSSYKTAFMTFIASSYLLSHTAYALPENAQVKAGQVDITQSTNQLDIKQHSAKAIVNWSGFDIQKHETVNFKQPSRNAVILNRVKGNNASQIYGKLNANGKVFLVNPNGITFSKNAQVNVGSLVASTLDIKDQDFLNGNYKFEAVEGSKKGKVLNQGHINASTIALLGSQVTNDGWIIASAQNINDTPNVALAAGNKINLSFGSSQELAVEIEQGAYDALVSNKQLIRADGGQVFLRAESADQLLGAAVNNSGIIQARGIGEKNGKIILLSDMQSGTTTVDGTLDASAISQGKGHGGFIDTSAANVVVKKSANISAYGKGGKNGLWLVDPTDLVINDSNVNAFENSLNNGTNLTLNTVANSNTATGNGDIFVNSDITWNTDDTVLTLQAQRNIEINAKIKASGENSGVKLDTKLSYNSGINWDKAYTDTQFAQAQYVTFGDEGRLTLEGKNAVFAQDGRQYQVINGNNDTITGSTAFQELQSITPTYAFNYALGVDVEGSEGNFTPLSAGKYKFDGLNNRINDLNITKSTANTGLFEAITSTSGQEAYLRNLHIENGLISGGSYLGAFAGKVSFAFIDNVSNQAAVKSVGGSVSDIGGIVGSMKTSLLTNSQNHGSVTASSSTGAKEANVGGITGRLWSPSGKSTINFTHNTGKVTGGNNTGGIIGYLVANNGASTSKIINSSNSGVINGYINVGGITGKVGAAGLVNKSYNNGKVTGKSAVGGVVGNSEGSGLKVNGSHNKGLVSGIKFVGGVVGRLVGGEIKNSFSIGNVQGLPPTTGFTEARLGGVAGSLYEAKLTNVYSTGTVKGKYRVGGIAGYMISSDIKGAYFSGIVRSRDGTNGTLALSGFSRGVIVGEIEKNNSDKSTIKNVVWYKTTLNNRRFGIVENNSLASPGNVSSKKWINDFKQLATFDSIFNIVNDSTCGSSAVWCIIQGQTLPGLNAARVSNYVKLNSIANSNKTYDGTSLTSNFTTPIITSKLNKFIVSANTSIETSSANAGRYKGNQIKLNGYQSSQFNVEVSDDSAALVINNKLLSTATVVNNKTYDANTTATANTTLAGVLNSEDVSLSSQGTATFNDKNAGNNKAVSIKGLILAGLGALNYKLPTGTILSTANIDKALLQLKLNNASKTFDSQAYTGGAGYSATGFASGESVANLMGQLIYSGSSQGAIDIGNYAISGAGLNSSNYQINYTPSTLVINKNVSIDAATNASVDARISKDTDVNCAVGLTGCISNGPGVTKQYLKNQQLSDTSSAKIDFSLGDKFSSDNLDDVDIINGGIRVINK